MADDKVSYNPTKTVEREEKTKVYDWESNSWKDDSRKTVEVLPADNATGMSKSEILEEVDSVTGGNSSDKSKTKKKATKEKDSIEIRTLQGNLTLRVNAKTIKLQVGETIKLTGLGKYLSGLYYITDISRTIGSSGYTQSLTVIKTNFTKTLKEQQVETVKSNVIQR